MSTAHLPTPHDRPASAQTHDHVDAQSEAPRFLPQWFRARWSWVQVGASGFFLAIGFFGERFAGFPHGVALAAYALSYVSAGYDVARHAFPAVIKGRFDTDLLMLAAAAGAAALGKWAEGSFLLFLFALGHAGEHYALDRARNAIGALGKLMPQTGRVKRGDRLEEVPVDRIAVGEIVVVRPGDRVPVDGTIVAGESTLDQSAITGESVPVARKPGDDVFAGTINQDNALDVRVTTLARDNTLAHVMRLVSEAEDQQSPTQQFTEKFTRRFVPAVLIGTALVVILPPLFFGWTWTASFYRGMLVLVAASPCALAIGTPAAVLAGIAQAARRGVLIKGGVHLENLGRLETVAFDKTGTLTTGDFGVMKVIAFAPATDASVLQLAAAVEEQSSHPLAAAIVREAKARGLAFASANGIQNLAGRGILAQVDGATVTIGALRAFTQDPSARKGEFLQKAVAALEDEGLTTVIVKADGVFQGVIALADQPRPTAQAALTRLRAQGVERLVMLTGDNQSVAGRVATAVGITEVRAELLPEHKLTAILELKRKHGPVAMVGDGVNDAPALAAATVGIAMGGAGTAVALETADAALMGDDLGKLAFAVGLGRASRRIIQQNLSIALGVILLLLVASMAGAIPLSVAVVLHEGSTVVVAMNALRLLAWKE